MLINLNDKKYSILSDDELNKLFVLYKNGSIEAKDEIVKHNLKLVLLVLGSIGTNIYNYDDLFQVGCVGLSKAVDVFDSSKNYKFSTFAVAVIRNEILMYLKRIKKHNNVGSLNEVISFKDGDVELHEMISDNSDFTLEIVNKELCEMVDSLLGNLNERNREVIKLYYGFYGKCYNQNEIASIVGFTQSGVCRVIKSSLNKLKEKLIENGIDDYDFTEGKTITKF